MEKPNYLSAINISCYVIIIILTIIKIVLNFIETVYNGYVISDFVLNFIILLSSIIMIILYKFFLVRMVVAYLNMITWIGALVTSYLSYAYILNDSQLKGIYNFSSYAKVALCFASSILSLIDDFDDY